MLLMLSWAVFSHGITPTFAPLAQDQKNHEILLESNAEALP